ncbi:alpha-L-rhamnosidase [Rathayibacter sp. VKM Ac-2857]|uniref:alpha-L-rhamnosidase n=1 Tax=Rathayibacter sp. VKM Ac-2857 TaxID=2739020 RepID=UPI0015655156|nr:alpha-L-rhamnosidase [Rathayibacter sp. VKM Ac-2857]NQX16612.1 family 78 glycoside hydrolase catalytic domain [Rathayibacter sp. VKM Ac-2857]
MTVGISISRVRFEHHEDDRLGIGESTPRLSWRYLEAPAGFVQTAVDVEVSIEHPGSADEVSRHHLEGPDQVLVPWPARPLRSRERVAVRVRPHGDHGTWSAPARVEVGLLEPEQWSASFVGPAWDDNADLRRPARVRADFDVPSDVVRARLYLTAHGLAQAEVNGRRVGDEELTPGWTTYRHRLRYATFDLTEHLHTGRNAIGIWLADGWWRGLVGFDGGLTDFYGTDQSALAQIELTRSDGSLTTIVSGPDWTAGVGPILTTGLYEGEHVDARLDAPAWSTAGWSGDESPVRVLPADASILVAPTGPPVRCTGELRPVSVQDRGNGRWLLDFGQNHSGRLRITGHGEEGDLLVLRHAEVLQNDELYTRTLRAADATDRLVLAGGDFSWEPRFTIHGYRYAEISGWRGPLDVGAVVSRVLHSDLERTGWFRSSHAGVNRLHENVVWSARSNFVDLPVDCPQRDERLGWTGDIQVFAPTAAFLYGVTGMLSSWLQDLAHDQDDRGTVPFYVPYLPLGVWAEAPVDPVAIWGDAAVLTPEALYDRTGDVDLLRRQYDSARAWVLQVEERAGEDLICEGTMQLGDWLDPAAPPEDPALATTDPALVATAYFARSARAMAKIARLVGAVQDADYFGDLGERVARAFAARYLDPSGRLLEDTQTAHSLATVFDLWPDAATRDAGGERLADLVTGAQGRVATGFAGTPVISDALALTGHLDEAYRMLLTDECPSWLYTVAMGATTIWERWDSMLPDGTVNPGDMTSFNHYALGAVADWLHRVVAGLAPAAPGYRRLRFAPRPGGGLISAGATHRTPYGDAAIDWVSTGSGLTVLLVVPVGTTAEVVLPGQELFEVGPGEHSFSIVLPAHAGALESVHPG